MKKTLVLAFCSVVALVVGCSSPAPQPAPAPEEGQQPAGTASQPSTEATSPRPIANNCPLEWECLAGPSAGNYYTNLFACGRACGGNGNCSRDYNCSGNCFCP